MEKAYKITKLLIWVLSFAVLIAGAWFLYNKLGANLQMDALATQPPVTEATDPAETEAEANLAPDFTVVDRNGAEVRLSDFRGKPVVLNFWASWCGPCKSEMPEFEEAWKQYGDEIHFVLVNLTDGSQETVESASAYIDGQGYTFPIYFDTSYSAAMAYGVNGVPVTYFIDEAGNLVAYGQGALSAETLQRGIDMIYTRPEG